MNTLEAVRGDITTLKAEIAHLEERLGVLQTIEELASGLDGVGEGAGTNGARTPPGSASSPRRNGKAPAPSPTPKPATARPRPQPRTNTGGPTIPERIVAYVTARGRVAGTKDIANNIEAPYVSTRKALQQLVKAGVIVAEGATKKRVYMSKAYADQRERERPHSRRGGVDGDLRELKARVLDLILTAPGALTEDRLAKALSVDREDIAIATGELLTDDRVALLPDGTYTGGMS